VFSGPAAQLGIQMRNGIKAYFDFVNEKGGVHGRKLELVTEDDRYEAAVAPQATAVAAASRWPWCEPAPACRAAGCRSWRRFQRPSSRARSPDRKMSTTRVCASWPGPR